MVLVDRGHIIATGTTQELQASTHPRVRQFLDRIPEAEVDVEADALEMLTGDRSKE